MKNQIADKRRVCDLRNVSGGLVLVADVVVCVRVKRDSRCTGQRVGPLPDDLEDVIQKRGVCDVVGPHRVRHESRVTFKMQKPRVARVALEKVFVTRIVFAGHRVTPDAFLGVCRNRDRINVIGLRAKENFNLRRSEVVNL